MNNEIESLDLDKFIGEVTLSNGKKLPVPKLSTGKLIKVVKFVGIDGAKLYTKFQSTIDDEEMDNIEKLVLIEEELEEEKLIHIFSILLDVPDQEALNFDLSEMLDIVIIYSDSLDLDRIFLQIRTLAKKLLHKDLPPTFKEWIRSLKFSKPVPPEAELGTEVKKILSQGRAGALSPLA